jgi:peptidoglycan/LPS O-acetylase OafA/YrhL
MQSQPWLTLHYAAMFGLGILTADNLRKLSSFYLSLRKIMRKVFMAGGLFLFSFGTMGTMGSPRFGYGYMNGGEWVVAAGCLVLMIASLNSISVSGFLSSGVPQWLGKISYSLYLLHSMVMFGLLHLLYGRIPLLAILPIFLAGTLVLSWLFYLLIESPSMRLSRRIGARRTAPRETTIPKKALVTELAER